MFSSSIIFSFGKNEIFGNTLCKRITPQEGRSDGKFVGIGGIVGGVGEDVGNGEEVGLGEDVGLGDLVGLGDSVLSLFSLVTENDNKITTETIKMKKRINPT
jgi:hypothetical protein